MPSVLHYTDYRKFLKDCFVFKRSQNKHFTFRYFAMKAGVKSSGFLKEVIDGKKGLTIHSIPKFIEPFGLSRADAVFFEKLVLFNQSKEEHEKSRYFGEMVKLQRNPRSRKISPKEYSFYTYWYNSVLREWVGLKNFQDDPMELARQITPAVGPGQIREALDQLRKLGFIAAGPNQVTVQSVPKLDIDPDVSGLVIRNFNRRMIELGWEAIERFDPRDREVSGLTLHISRDAYYHLKEMARKFMDDLFDFACNHPAESEVVCRLNVQLFPFNRNMEKETHGRVA
jgi:uncharacterized protein (TIGR02147 family)